MALSFSDFLSFFSQASDGQRLRGPNEAARDTAAGDPSGILNHVQTTGAPQVAPQRPQQAPARPKAQGVLSPIIQQGGVGGPVTEAYAGNGVEQGPQQNPPALDLDQYERAPDITRGPPQGPQPLPPEFTQYEQGILSKVGDFLGPNFLGRLGNGLMVAGSQDPVKALTMLRQQEAEEGAMRAKQTAAQKPKIVPIQGGAFSLVTFPDGSMQSIPNKDVMDFQRQIAEQQRLGKIDYAELQARLSRLGNQEKLDDKIAADMRPALNETTSLIEKYEKAAEMVGGQGMWAQFQGIPGVNGLANFFGTDAAAQNKFLQGLAVSETLLNTALTKGAISNQEMDLFKSPIPTIADHRENVWKPYIQERLPVLRKLAEFQRSEVARGERRPDTAPAVQASQAPQAAPAPQATPKAAPGGLPSVSNDADYAKIPSGTRYVSPDGKIRQKP